WFNAAFIGCPCSGHIVATGIRDEPGRIEYPIVAFSEVQRAGFWCQPDSWFALLAGFVEYARCGPSPSGFKSGHELSKLVDRRGSRSESPGVFVGGVPYP